MAAPASHTLTSLSGEYTLDKSSSDDFASVLALQGVSTLVRKAASAASVHLSVSQPDRDHVRMQQTVTAGKIPGTTEEYILDWEWRDKTDAFFGKIQGRSRWVGVREARREGIVADGVEWVRADGKALTENEEEGSEQLIQAEGRKADGDWEAAHLWGFEVVDGQRKHTRRVRVRNKDGEELKVRMVYDLDAE